VSSKVLGKEERDLSSVNQMRSRGRDSRDQSGEFHEETPRPPRHKKKGGGEGGGKWKRGGGRGRGVVGGKGGGR